MYILLLHLRCLFSRFSVQFHAFFNVSPPQQEWIVEGRLPEPVVMLLQILRYYWNEFWRDTNTDSAANKVI